MSTQLIRSRKFFRYIAGRVEKRQDDNEIIISSDDTKVSA